MSAHDDSAVLTLLEGFQSEFRAFRDTEFREKMDALADWKLDTGERLSVVETTVCTAIVGVSGTPSRLTLVEKTTQSIQKSIWTLAGAGSVIGAVVGYLANHFWPPKI
jgi:hypothetical protein